MNDSPIPTVTIPRVAMLCVALPFLSGVLPAQPSSAARIPAPLGLTRLKETAKAGEAAPVTPGKFAPDDLAVAMAPNGGASKAKKDNVDYLALDAGKQWSSPLRGNPRDPTYASFMVHGSQNTIIEVGGARLGVTAGPIPGSLQLMFDDSSSPTGTLQWNTLNVHIATGTYGGKTMAALPVLTVAVDPTSGLWHLYSGSRLLADHLPLIPAKKDDRKFIHIQKGRPSCTTLSH